MLPWQSIASAEAPDGAELELLRRGGDYLMRAGGYDLMSSEDEPSSRALAELGCSHLDRSHPVRVLIGGLGMGYTLRAALDRCGPRAVVEVAELVPAVVSWNRSELAALADRPLTDPRAELFVGDVAERISAGSSCYDAILLDVDNGPDALAHAANDRLYSVDGVAAAHGALRNGGVLGVWSFSDDAAFTERLAGGGFAVEVEKVEGSRKGRGRRHVIWIARRTR